MGEGRAALLFATLAACGFDSGGVGGSGTPQGSSSADTGSASTSMTAGVESESTDTPTATDAASTSSADTSTSSASAESSTGVAPTSDTSTGETGEGPPEFGPFAAPVAIDELNTNVSDDDPTLSPDLLEIYFASLRLDGSEGDEDIWRATRESPEDTFDPPEPVAVLNGVGQDGWPELSHDGLVLTLASNRDSAVGLFDVYVSVRDSLGDDFGEPVRADDLSGPDNEAAAVFSSTMLEVFLCAPLGDSDLYFASRPNPNVLFGELAPLTTVNSSGRDCTPFIDESGTRLVFSSDRVGTVGDMDIWTAQRDTDGDAFEASENVEALNTMWNDDDPWWAPDGSAVYFSSERGPGGDLDLYVAYRE